jgi:hypothetical protein
MSICRRAVAILLIAMLSIPAVSVGQQQNQPASSTVPAAVAPRQRNSTQADTNLPVSLERIRRELIHQAARSRNDSHGLDIRYYVEVYGKAPETQIFSRDTDLVHGPVPYGGMTHQEFLNLVTPQEFRAPAADLTMLPMLLAKWLADRQKEKKKEEEASKQ